MVASRKELAVGGPPVRGGCWYAEGKKISMYDRFKKSECKDDLLITPEPSINFAYMELIFGTNLSNSLSFVVNSIP